MRSWRIKYSFEIFHRHDLVIHIYRPCLLRCSSPLFIHSPLVYHLPFLCFLYSFARLFPIYASFHLHVHLSSTLFPICSLFTFRSFTFLHVCFFIRRHLFYTRSSYPFLIYFPFVFHLSAIYFSFIFPHFLFSPHSFQPKPNERCGLCAVKAQISFCRAGESISLPPPLPPSSKFPRSRRRMDVKAKCKVFPERLCDVRLAFATRGL